jgi:DNA polymerase-3 subunit epsilon
MKVGIFDTETDSLISNSAIPLDKQPRIAELFGLTVKHGKADCEEQEAFDVMMNIGRPMSEEASRITGITDEMLKDKRTFAQEAPRIVEWIEAHDRIVAHNLAFDKSVVDFQLRRVNHRPVNWPELLCTVEATEFIKGYRLSLSALHEELFGEGFENAHRAESDVRALTRCYAELARQGIV